MNSIIKQKQYAMIMASVALLLAGITGCQNDETAQGFYNDPLAVHITPTAGNTTVSRSNPEATDVEEQKKFNAGDKITLAAGGKTVVYTAAPSGTSLIWAPAAGEYLTWETAGKPMQMEAFYPAGNGSNNASMTTFVLPADQSGDASTSTHISQADYMTFGGNVTQGEDNTASIALMRQTARVQIKIASYGDQLTTDARCEVKVNSLHGGISATDGYADAKLITPHCNQNLMNVNDVATALVIPGAADAGKQFLAITVYPNGSKSETGKLTLSVNGIPEAIAGKSYIYNVRVGKDKAEITDVTVADWNGDVIAGGKAEEVYVGLVNNIDTSKNEWVITDENPTADNIKSIEEKLRTVYTNDNNRRIKLTIENATAIERDAFTQCSSLSSINLPKATTIGSMAFDRDENLISINLPKVTTIGQGAFINCPKVTSITFGTPITSWDRPASDIASANITLTLASEQKDMTWRPTTQKWEARDATFTDFGSDKQFCGGSNLNTGAYISAFHFKEIRRATASSKKE